MEEPEVHLLDYLKVVYRRKWLILALMLIAMALGAFHTYRAVPVYQASCTIRIEDQTSTVIRSGQVVQYTDYWSSEKNINTHLNIMLSEPVLERLIDSLTLRTSSSTQLLPAALKGFIKVDPVKDTNLIRVKATHPDAHTAQALANTMATAYRDFAIEKRAQSSQNNVMWLKKEIADLKSKMEEAYHNLYQYKKQSEILSLEKEAKMQAEELSQLRSAYNQTRVKRIEIAAQIEELKRIIGSKNKYIPAFLQGDILPALNNSQVQARLELAQLKKKYGPKHPKIIAAKAHIRSIQRQINQNIQKAIKGLQSEHAVLKAKEETLNDSIKRYTQDAMETEQKEIQYALLERETQLNKELYDVLVAKLKELNITEGLDQPEVTIVEMADLPKAPLNTRRNMNLIMSAVIGLLFSLGLAFFLDYLDIGITTREEAERFLGLPVLGVIPQTQTKH
jgi:uncharacterized protein involved in exopolysaccharide biosynthesis